MPDFFIGLGLLLACLFGRINPCKRTHVEPAPPPVTAPVPDRAPEAA